MRIHKISCIFVLAMFGLLNLTPVNSHVEKPASPAAPEVSATNSHFSENSNIEIVGHLGGSSNASFAQGDYVYAAFDFELAIFDLSDPPLSLQVSSTFLDDSIQAIYVAGDYAFIANLGQGMLIFDISNPSLPTEVGRYIPAGVTYAVWVQGDLVYLGSEGDHFWEITVLDFSIPYALELVNTIIVPDNGNGHINDLVVVENTVYVTHSENVFYIVDLASSHFMQYDACDAHDFAIHGDFAYFACGINYFDNGLGYINLTDLNSPFMILFWNGLWDIVVNNDYIYGVGDEGLDIFDIQDPSLPITVTHVDISNYPSSIVLVEGNAVVGGIGGISIFDTSTTPTDPTIIGSYGLDHRFSGGGAIAGDYIYLTGADGLLAVDITDPARPFEAGFLPLLGSGGVAAVGDYAYVLSSNGLHIIDISNPAVLVEVGYVNIEWGREIEVVGDHAYIARIQGLQIIDISNPTAPLMQGFYEQQELAVLAVKEPYVYVTMDPIIELPGMDVIDVSNPMNPVKIGAYNPPAFPRFVDPRFIDIEDNIAYVTGFFLDVGPGLMALDISDPYAPQALGSFSAHDETGKVAASGSNVFFLVPEASNKQLEMVDASDPSALIEAGFYTLPTFSNQRLTSTTIEAMERFVYVIDFNSNLIVLRYIGKSIVGRVRQANGCGFPGVSVDAGAGVSEPSDANGFYRISELSSGTYTLTSVLGGYRFIPVTQTVTLSQAASLPFFAILPEPISTTLSTSVTNTLAYSDTQDLLTQFEFPGNAVITATTLVAAPQLGSSLNGYQFTGHAFELSADQAGAFIPDLLFNSPVTVTIQYSDFDVRLITDESQLELWWWDGNAWQDAIQTCEPETAYFYDPEMNRLQIPICKTGKYALYGPTHQVYVPFAMNTSLP